MLGQVFTSVFWQDIAFFRFRGHNRGENHPDKKNGPSFDQSLIPLETEK